MKKTKEGIWAEWLAKDLSYTEAAIGAMEEYAQQERPSKDELISMVRGIEPNNFKMMEHWMIAGRGSYSDKDGWRWNNTILNLNEHELRTLYVFCKTCNDEYIATKSNS